MRIKDQIQTIQGAFEQWTQEQGGSVFICSDLAHLWAKLYDQSNACKVLIMYDGEMQRENFPGGAITARVDRRFLVAISRGRGLAADRGQTLVESTNNARPLFELVDEARDMCRGLVFDPLWTERPVDYISTRPMSMGTEIIADAYQISFSVGTQLGMLEAQ